MRCSAPESARPSRHFPSAFAAGWILSWAFLACYDFRPGQSGSQAESGVRSYSAGDIALPAGYRIETVATGLTFPTQLAFDDTGGMHIVESGYSYGNVYAVPRLLRPVGPDSFATVAAGADSNGPWNGAIYVPDEAGKGRGSFYVAEGGHRHGGRILRINRDGRIERLVEGLPSLGDHHTNGPALGPDGMIYFGQGTATNSGVVGEDNAKFGWLGAHPGFHDTPCQDVLLTGANYPGRDADTGKAHFETGAFVPYGARTTSGQTIPGEVPCNGAIMRIPRQGGKPELVAWGFRNPYAVAFAPDGRLFAVDNGYDERGSRPIWGAGELFWEVHQGKWYGWPDYSGDRSVTLEEFTPPHSEHPRAVLREPPGPWLATQAAAGHAPPGAESQHIPSPVVVLPVHASADGLDFSRSQAFGFEGQAFVAEFGDMAPDVGKVLEPVGFKVVRVNLSRGTAEDFAVNRKGLGPASRLGTGGLERPISVRFSPDGKSLYVVDFGVMTLGPNGPEPRKRTGSVWRIWRESGK
jgi:glucose/arabinose dehydrogenase